MIFYLLDEDTPRIYTINLRAEYIRYELDGTKLYPGINKMLKHDIFTDKNYIDKINTDSPFEAIGYFKDQHPELFI